MSFMLGAGRSSQFELLVVRRSQPYGGYVQMWDCNYNSNQLWNSSGPSSHYLEVRTPAPPDGPNKCLDAWPNSPGSYTAYNVSVWDCNGGDQQRWDDTVCWDSWCQWKTLRNVKFNLCLDIADTTGYNGTPLTLRDCGHYQGMYWALN